ncbi:MAG: right-handed parallel beta-helix repeat-containing protein [bacterium]|nr:right-handed parallel beta-helix repeat-containing protein [bacterium]
MNKTTFLILGTALAALFAGAEPRPDLVTKVQSGELKEARASWWGFDREDATKFLQAAIDSRVPRLIVDRMESPWVVLPLQGVSNQELVLEEGAEIRAKRGEYKAKGACLLTYRGCENIKVTGYRAALRMWHEDYMKEPYEKSEWRHALSILSCSNVVVQGLTIASSGGDGIYLGAAGKGPRKNMDVVIRDVLCHDNHRQGISVITAENLLIENTVMRETHGTPPAAGIDFEPNHPEEVLKNCVMRNCLTVNNQGCGYTTWAGQLNSKSEPVDIRFENCTSFGDRTAFSFACDSRRGRDVAGNIVIRNCSFEKSRSPITVNLRENRFGTVHYTVESSRVVITNTAGNEVVIHTDDDWRKEHIPHQADPDFMLPHVEHPDLAHAAILDEAPGTAVKLQPMRIRNRGTYIVYADAARPLNFSGHQCRVGRYAPAKKPIVVTGLDGKPVAKIPLPESADKAFSFKAPAAGFYRMTLDLSSVAFTLTSSDAPVALDVTEGSQNLISSAGTMWLQVPKGAKDFALYVSGEGVERVHVTLDDPQNMRVWDHDNISNWSKAVLRPALPGLWTIKVSRPSQGCFEDSKYDVAGIPGFLFLSKEKTWVCP